MLAVLYCLSCFLDGNYWAGDHSGGHICKIVLPFLRWVFRSRSIDVYEALGQEKPVHSPVVVTKRKVELGSEAADYLVRA
jgi:hypothetical protein